MAGFVSLEYAHATRLASAAAVNCIAAVLGGAVAGKARDTLLQRVFIPANATAVTLTIAGLNDSAGAPANLVLTGSTTQDTTYAFEQPLLNEGGAFVFTASVANLVWVHTKPYTAG
jgi:hypothetical protein